MERYDTSNSALANSPGYGTSPQIDQKPVTLEVTDRLRGNINIANEIRSKLWTLRDRLIGPPGPSQAASNSAVEREPSCFADAAAQAGRQLELMLYDIDSLTSELANRL
jgi:hypothetical protein